jgi:hypothetical protein
MRIVLYVAMFSVVTSAAVPTVAHAGGWPGTHTYGLRADVPAGVTLKRLWSRVNGR